MNFQGSGCVHLGVQAQWNPNLSKPVPHQEGRFHIEAYVSLFSTGMCHFVKQNAAISSFIAA